MLECIHETRLAALVRKTVVRRRKSGTLAILLLAALGTIACTPLRMLRAPFNTVAYPRLVVFTMIGLLSSF